MSMWKRMGSICFGLICFLSLGVLSIQADPVRFNKVTDDMNHGRFIQQAKLNLLTAADSDLWAFLFPEHSNGKHLGLTMSALHRGPRVGVVGYYPQLKNDPAPTPNPEPTSMLLFGSGLLAIGAIARSKLKARK